MPTMPPKSARQTAAIMRLARAFFTSSTGLSTVIGRSHRPVENGRTELDDRRHVENDNQRKKRKADRHRAAAPGALLAGGEGDEVVVHHKNAPLITNARSATAS